MVNSILNLKSTPKGHLRGHGTKSGRAAGRMSGAIETVHELSLKAAAALFGKRSALAANEGPQVGLQIRKSAFQAVRKLVLDL